MTDQKNNITCPNCHHEINVNDILYHQIDDKLKKQYQAELMKEKETVQLEKDRLNVEKKALELERHSQKERMDQAVKETVASQTQQIQAKLKKEIYHETADQISALQSTVKEKSEQVKELNTVKSHIERLKREKDELRGAIEAESEKKLSQVLNDEKEKIKKREFERAQLKISEKETVIDQLNTKLKEAQRKAEQGSMQLQGEVQELAIEEWLQSQFPLDTIEPIKKGARGGDCIQIVNTRSKQHCGQIYVESKRTKGFQPLWIEKFKADIRERGADIGVLVTQVLPSDMDRMGIKDGIWICTFEEFKGLCVVLRESIIRVSHVVSNQDNKGDKMTMLYTFLTSN